MAFDHLAQAFFIGEFHRIFLELNGNFTTAVGFYRAFKCECVFAG